MIDPASDLYQIIKAGGAWIAVLPFAALFAWQEWKNKGRF